MRGADRRLGLAALIFALYLGALFTGIASKGTQTVVKKAPAESPALADLTYFNATELFEGIWPLVSQDNIGNYTEQLSETYPNRTWSSGPSQALSDAWTWAENILTANTGGALSFTQETEYQSLVAVKNGTAPSPRPAIVLTGVIDSGKSPGANDDAISTAVILELARILQPYSFAYDVYYVLLNGVHISQSTDYGGQALVQWLVDEGVQTFTTISFDRLLFNRVGYMYGFSIGVRSYSATGNYHDAQWIPDLMTQISHTYGHGYIVQVIDLTDAQRSCAYEMWQVGRPAVFVSQGYWRDPQSDTKYDTLSNPDYFLPKVTEVVATTAAVVAYMGVLGTGEVPQRYLTGHLNATEQTAMRLTVSLKGYLNATVTWDGPTTIQASIVDSATDEVVYQRTESNGAMNLKYLAQSLGEYRLNVTNIGANPTNFTLSVTAHQDMDGDTIPDDEEVVIGTSPYLRDTDQDGLTDNFELSWGTNPLSNDTDGDGASDFYEYTVGSNPLVTDTDGDNITDGVEETLGTNLTCSDTDHDGLSDYMEVYILHTNPLSADTDGDGLEDGFEYEMGLNPRSPDSDNDSLSDMFEILNGLNPLSNDTDGDGWSDAYEVQYCMSPTSADTDGDGIPDGIDWDPREPWITVVSPVALLSIIMLLVIYAFLKGKAYTRK